MLGLPGLRSSRPGADQQRRLADAYGRVAADLRLSLTDRCNLRCTYCMPAEGLDWMDRSELLDDDEIVRLVRIGTERLGITTVRLTGGEPLLRRGLEGLVARLAALEPSPVLALTTNGIGLAGRAEALRAAGLNRINVSLDTLNPDTFAELTRRRRHADVLAGIRAARAAGLDPVKINAVLMRGVNDHEAPDMLRWALDEGVQLRFIEQMPLDAQHGWRRADMVTAAETLARLRTAFSLVVDPAHAAARGSAPAELFRVVGTDRTVGVIASVTQPFCGSCDRVRLTADGQIRTCLFAREESDLRLLLRGGADDATIADAWVTAVAGKQPGHGIDDPSFLQPDRPMSAIGG
ncbi:GTP 3',8-cyclase MoaA [Microlunatus antarcticus]|uniref:GTP 3',8-cyclase MoaA n=1 Tax=Microlunatus antarcticus TaxID=53388 RepID=UPI001E2D88C3|nr:GTP 3',8-cyclase MoaA [Microlunatus antarcticus]